MVGLPRSSGRWMDPSVLSKQILVLPLVVPPTRPMRTHFRSVKKIPTLRGVQYNQHYRRMGLLSCVMSCRLSLPHWDRN